MKMKFKAFTLAEIMIVLSVIGVLTAILLPVARNAMPNKDVMKFKKAHNAFYNAIRELVTSDKYYLDGDLGVKPDKTLVEGENNYTYLCQTMADVLNTKKVNCVQNTENEGLSNPSWSESYNPEKTFGNWIDDFCRNAQMDAVKNIQPDQGIILSDGTVIYETGVHRPFGRLASDGSGKRSYITHTVDSAGFTNYYKVLCIDIDGVELGSHNTCKGLCPFAYGVRYDGKIKPGELAQQWLEKSIQDKD